MALTIGDNFSYQGAKPLDTRLQYATIAEMKAKADSTLYDGIIAYCKADGKNYQWKSTNTVDETLGKWREFQSGGGGVSELANLDDVDLDEPADGEVLKYDEETGKWVNGEDIGGVGRAKSTAIAPVFDETATYAAGDRVTYEDELYVFNKAHTGAWDAADADKTDVDSEMPEKLTAAQMAAIKAAFVIDTPRTGYPIMFDETGAEHVVAWYKLANGTKKPVYQKTIDCSSITTDGSRNVMQHNISNIDKVININGFVWTSSGGYAIPSDYDVSGDESAHGNSQVRVSVGSVVMSLTKATNMTISAVYVTIQYTKTTDTPQ